MRIALPLVEGKFALHYGSSDSISLHDIDAAHGVAKGAGVVATPAEGMCGAGPWLAAQGVEVLLAGGIGAGAARGLADAGVRVFAGVQDEDARKVLELFLAGLARARELAPGESMCKGHGEGGHEHGHHHGEGHVCTCGN